MTLYDVANEILLILDDASAEDGELPAGAEERLDALQMTLVEKADNILALAQCELREGEALKAEAERMAKLGQAKLRRVERLKAYLLRTLEATGQRSLATQRFAVSVCNNSVPTVTLEPGAPVPADYQRTRVELDARRVADDWRAGKPLPEAVKVVLGKHLRVR